MLKLLDIHRDASSAELPVTFWATRSTYTLNLAAFETAGIWRRAYPTHYTRHKKYMLSLCKHKYYLCIDLFIQTHFSCDVYVLQIVHCI